MTLNIASTTDSPEAVQAAVGDSAPSEPAKETSAPAKDAGQKVEADSETVDDGEEENETDPADQKTAESKEKPDTETPPKKKGGFQRRIDKLNARVADKDRELDYWKQQAMGNQGHASTTQEHVAPVPGTAEGKPNPETFDSHKEYIEALTEWTTEQKLNQRDQKAEIARLETDRATKVDAYRSRENDFREKVADYDEVIGEVNDVQLSPALTELLLESDNSSEIVYTLAKDPAEFKKLNSMGPLAVAREFGKLESRLSKPQTQEIQNKVTKAPKPPTPVGSKGGNVDKDPDQMPYQEYKQWRESKLKRR